MSYLSKYTFSVQYKLDKDNILADALYRRPDLELTTIGLLSSGVHNRIHAAYPFDAHCSSRLAALTDPVPPKPHRASSALHRFALANRLWMFQPTADSPPRIAVPGDAQLYLTLLRSYHDSPSGGHFGRDKMYLILACSYCWPCMYKSVMSYVAHCDVCQRTKIMASSWAPLQPLSIPNELWSSVSMNFMIGLPRDARGNTGIMVCVEIRHCKGTR
ncbi:hypothetical protein AaE_005605 [Aphanomyces astaci]|uniref:Integrase zinc-binding domain-containing protein n=1 Tax=Aphanomyces astaci TaxID=112090 RepID=A0A6A5AKA1_APHAT|nr:hypothetical protein AaE_005605 [Aphanomyces astaci]